VLIKTLRSLYDKVGIGYYEIKDNENKASTSALSSLHPKCLQVLHLILIKRLLATLQQLSRTTLKGIVIRKLT